MARVESAATPPLAPPPQPQPPAPPRALRLRLADFVVVFVAFGFLGFAWLSSAATAALVAAEWGYGWASVQAAATKEFAVAASVLLGLFVHAVTLILVSQTWRDASRRAEATEREELVHGAVTVPLVAVFMILVLAMLIQVISWAIGARDEKAGYLLVETVFFISSVLFCLVTIPLLIIRVVVLGSTPETRHETAVSH